MADGERKFWLFKSAPFVFSIDDLATAKGKRTSWEGVRNYQVRNMLRDDMQKGDGVLFYHSRVDPMVIAGTAEIVKPGYPDFFALDPEHKYFDPKSTAEKPTPYSSINLGNFTVNTVPFPTLEVKPIVPL